MLKKFLLAVALVTAGVALTPNFAEAARIGGGRSAGIQRTMPRQMPRQATPAPAPNRAAPAATPRPAAAPAAAQPSGWRKWMGPIAGIAGAIGLAALLSKFGMGGDFAGMMLLVIGGLVAFMLIRRMLAGARPAQSQSQPAYAGMQQAPQQPWQAREAEPASFGGSAAPEAAGEALNVPAGFDVESFERQAKVNFIRLQAANDAGNIADIRDFTSPEMFAEIKLDIDARKGRPQRTDVVELHAQVIEVVEEAGRYIASVRYFGSLREEEGRAPQDFDEVWHLSKPVDGNQGWMLSGIQQLN